MRGIKYDFDIEDVTIAGDGFSGPYEEFGVKDLTRLNIYFNFYRARIPNKRQVKVTAEVRCNYDLLQGPSLNVVTGPVMGSAKTVTYIVGGSTNEYLYLAPVSAMDAFLQIRVLKVENIDPNDTPIVFPDDIYTESENTYWVSNGTTMTQTSNVAPTPGPFTKAIIDNQNVALIAVSQVCRITKPELGAQVGARIVNRRTSEIASVLADAKKQAQDDGATDVTIELTDEQLLFKGRYED